MRPLNNEMESKNITKGVLLVGLGASSYGMLATFVKLAYQDHFTTAEVTTSQFILGIVGLIMINLFQKLNKKKVVKTDFRSTFKLMLAGTSLGMTSVFYYLAVRYIPVSIGIVLLMQTVWMAVILEMILEKKTPSVQKISAVIIVLLGTALAINIFDIAFNDSKIDWAKGLTWGLLAAASFTMTMFTSNRVATQLSSAKRSLYMLLGGTLIVAVFLIMTQNTPFNFDIFTKWGIILALFGTIIPPMLLNAGFPYTGIGIGSIVSSIELPVSVFMAFVILNEKVILLQWIGIALIIFAIVLMNIKLR